MINCKIYSPLNKLSVTAPTKLVNINEPLLIIIIVIDFISIKINFQ